MSGWLEITYLAAEQSQETRGKHELASLHGYSVTVQDVVYLIHWFTEVCLSDLFGKR